MKDRSTVSTVLAAPPEWAFAVLENPTSFERLIAGARRIRRFDPRWPDQGTAVQHTVGIPPLLVRDSTLVLEVDKPSRLRMEARLWPFGTLMVQFEFSPHPDGSRMVVREEPHDGPIALPVVRDLARAALRARNLEICRRYRKLLDGRA